MVDSHEMQRRGPWQWRHDASKIGSTSKAKSGGWAWTGETPRPINGARMSQPNLADTLVERETGIEPATNGLGSRDSTAELLPPRQPQCNLIKIPWVLPLGSDELEHFFPS